MTNPPRYIWAEAPGGGTATLTYTFTGSGAASNFSHTTSIKITGCGIEIDVTSPQAGVSANPPPFEGGKAHAFDVTHSPNPDKHFVVFYKDVVDANFNVQDFSIALKANTVPEVSPSFISDRNPRWTKLSGPNSGALSSTAGVEVDYVNPKEGGVYQFAFDLDDYPRTEFPVVLPLGGPDVTDYFLSETQRYEEWLSALRERLFDASASEFARGVLVLSYFGRTVANMNHKHGTYESASSPCKQYCNGTVTIAGHVFGKDHIGNFLYAYMAARIDITLRQTRWCADFIDVLHKRRDAPDDQAAYAAGHALGLDPTGDFKTILEALDIPPMQNEAARRGWPSEDVATGVLYPTWGATPGLYTPD